MKTQRSVLLLALFALFSTTSHFRDDDGLLLTRGGSQPATLSDTQGSGATENAWTYQYGPTNAGNYSWTIGDPMTRSWTYTHAGGTASTWTDYHTGEKWAISGANWQQKYGEVTEDTLTVASQNSGDRSSYKWRNDWRLENDNDGSFTFKAAGDGLRIGLHTSDATDGYAYTYEFVLDDSSINSGSYDGQAVLYFTESQADNSPTAESAESAISLSGSEQDFWVKVEKYFDSGPEKWRHIVRVGTGTTVGTNEVLSYDNTILDADLYPLRYFSFSSAYGVTRTYKNISSTNVTDTASLASQNWSYDSVTGRWSNASTNQEWSYNASTDVWTNHGSSDSLSEDWAYDMVTGKWTHQADNAIVWQQDASVLARWTYKPGVDDDVWEHRGTDAGNGMTENGWIKRVATPEHWEFNETNNTWIERDNADAVWTYNATDNDWDNGGSSKGLPIHFPPRLLVQRELIYKKAEEISAYDWNVTGTQGADWSGASDSGSGTDTLTYDYDAASYKISAENSVDSQFWRYNPSSGQWNTTQAILFGSSPGHKSASFDGATTWTGDLDSNWSYASNVWTQGAVTWTWSPANQEWTWSNGGSPETWTYSTSNGQWTDGTDTWRYKFLEDAWREISSNDATPTNMPPLPVIMQTIIRDAVDVLRTAGAFSTAGATSWTAPTESAGTWTSTNGGSDEEATCTPATPAATWKITTPGFDGDVSWTYNPTTGVWTWTHSLDLNSASQTWSTVNTNATTQTWTDAQTSEEWTFNKSAKVWTKTVGGATWSYNKDGQKWTYSTSGHDWTYSAANDQWTNSSNSTVWAYDFVNQTWSKISGAGSEADMPALALVQHMHIRNVMARFEYYDTTGDQGPLSVTTYNSATVAGDLTTFSETSSAPTVADTSWTYTPSDNTWTWTHGHDEMWQKTWSVSGTTWTDQQTNDQWVVTTPDADTIQWDESGGSGQWKYSLANEQWTNTEPVGDEVWIYNHSNGQWTNTSDGNTIWTYEEVSSTWDKVSGAGLENDMPPFVVWQQARIWGTYDVLRGNLEFKTGGSVSWTTPSESGGTWTTNNGTTDEQATCVPATPAVTWKTSKGLADNEVNWTYNPTTGVWTWTHALDENSDDTTWSTTNTNATTQTWTDGTNNYTFNKNTKIWTIGGYTWTYDASSSTADVLHWDKSTGSAPNWTYTISTDLWNDGTNNWRYDFTTNQWLLSPGMTIGSPTDAPDVALVQHMHIRNVMARFEYYDTSGDQGPLSVTAYNTPSASGDLTTISETSNTPTVADVSWTYTPSDNTWSWTHGFDEMWQKTWSVSGTTWTDAQTNDQWVVTTPDADTIQWDESGGAGQWKFSLATEQWTNTEPVGDEVWSYNHSNGQWTNTSDGNTIWTYDEVSGTWDKVSGAGLEDDMPPFVVWQQARIWGAYDVVRGDAGFRTSGAVSWTTPTQSGTEWTSTNNSGTDSDETLVFDDNAYTMVWKTSKGLADDEVTWTYTPSTGVWTWTHKLDENSVDQSWSTTNTNDTTQTWTDGTNNYTYGKDTKIWTIGGYTWTFDESSSTADVLHWDKSSGTNQNWTYTISTDLWNDGSNNWRYDFTGNQWLLSPGMTVGSPTDAPDVALVQHMHIRNAMDHYITESVVAMSSGLSGLSTSVAGDLTTISETTGTTAGIEWTYTPNPGGNDTWVWENTFDQMWRESWTMDGTNWTHDESNVNSWDTTTPNSGYDFAFENAGQTIQWDYDAATGYWTKDTGTNEWQYDHGNSQWKHSDDNFSTETVWSYDYFSDVWAKISGSGSVEGPPFVVIQTARMWAIYDTLRTAAEFKTGGSVSWTAPSESGGTWTTNNGTTDEQATCVPATPAVTWKTSKGLADNEVNWTYNPTTGVWTWTHALDENSDDTTWSTTNTNATTQTWTDGTNNYTFNKSTKVWTVGGVTWTYDATSSTSDVLHWDKSAGAFPNWTYTISTDLWNDGSTNWRYDFTSNQWLQSPGMTIASPTDAPDLPLVQHMHVRNVMARFEYYDTTGNAGPLSVTEYGIATPSGDLTTMSAVSNTPGVSDVSWTYTPSDNTWSWTQGHDEMWQKTWSVSGTTWTDAQTNDQWVVTTPDADTIQWDESGGAGQWKYSLATGQWTNTEPVGDEVWSYNYNNGQWTNTSDGNTVWTYEEIANTWDKVSGAGLEDDMPPLVVWQQARIWGDFDLLRLNAFYKTSGAVSWTTPTQSGTEWTSTNNSGTNSDETLVFDDNAYTMAWKTSKGFVDDEVTWTYTPSTGVWTWTHKLDEDSVDQSWSTTNTNDTTQTWTDGTNNYTYGKDTKVWTIGGYTWTFDEASSTADVLHWDKSEGSYPNWTYTISTDAWNDGSNNWRYDFTSNKWLQYPGLELSSQPTDAPDLPLVQHMHIRNAMDHYITESVVAMSSGLSGLSTSVAGDLTTISETTGTTAGIEWTYTPNPGGNDTWVWENTFDQMWRESWTMDGTNWTHDESNVNSWDTTTPNSGYDFAFENAGQTIQWDYDAATGYWTKDTGTNEWQYDHGNSQWKHSDDSFSTETVWSYDYFSDVWAKISGSGSVEGPPFVVIQTARMWAIYDTLRTAAEFKTSGSVSWTTPTNSAGTWTSNNGGTDEQATCAPATPVVTWKTSKGLADGEVSWTYNPGTGVWSWTHALDENSDDTTWSTTNTNATTQTWTDGTNNYTFNKSTRVWTIGGVTWTYDATSSTHNVIHWDKSAGAFPNWTYTISTDLWNDGTTDWRYDFTSNQWLQSPGMTIGSPTDAPDLPLVQHMHIRNVMYKFETSKLFSWSVDSNTSSATTIGQTGANDFESTQIWTYTPGDGSWSWDLVHDEMWQYSWDAVESGGNLTWTDAVTDEEWVGTVTEGVSIVWDKTGASDQWTYTMPSSLTSPYTEHTQSWTNTGADPDESWTYSYSTGKWTCVADSSDWIYDDTALDASDAWTETTSVGSSPSMPPRVVWQQALMWGVFDSRRTAGAFDTSAAIGWAPALSAGEWTSYNSDNNEYMAYNVGTNTLTWKTIKGSTGSTHTFVNDQVNFSYDPTDASWTWNYKLDENSAPIQWTNTYTNATTNTWSDGVNTDWTYNKSTRVWTDGTSTWTYSTSGRTWSKTGVGHNWFYDVTRDQWINKSDSDHTWRFQMARQEWVDVTGGGTEANMPDLPLIQHMRIRSLMYALRVAGAFTRHRVNNAHIHFS